jgi:iron(III) transport system ATP-binding protein
MIEIVGLCKSWGSQPVLHGLNLTIAPGERVVLSGPSGCGKTTLLRIIAGLETPDEGSIAINGQVVTGDSPPVPPCRRHLGVVFQQAALWPNMTVRGNIAFACRRENAAQKRVLIDKITELCGVGDLLNRNPATLSGGQARRVALARAFASRPRYLLLDEPTSNLDDASRATLNAAVRAFVEEERSGVLYISHVKADIDEIAGTHVTLADGRLQG